MKKIVVLLLIILFSTSYAKTDVKKVVKKMQQKFKKAETLKLDFKQTNSFKLTGVKNEIFGTLWMTKSNKFRFETEDQTIVTDGETYWRYNKLDEQVLIDHAEKTQGEMFLTEFIFKIEENYYAQLIKEEKQKAGKILEIKLTPKDSDESFFEYIKVWLNEKKLEINKIQYTDYNGNDTGYEVESFDLNLKFEQGIFNYNAPDGIEVVDLRF